MGRDVIIACDFDSAEKTYAFLDQFKGKKPFVKIGMELYYAEGPSIVRELKKRGHKIFLDLKLHDIPNTVKKSMAVLSRLDVDMCTESRGGRGWKQVGYTDLFHLDGTVERLVDNNEDANVDPWEITNGARGYNRISRHIVYVGGVDANDRNKAIDTRTVYQKEAMRRYVLDFHRRFPTVRIVGHRELDGSKACPSFNVGQWLREIGIFQ